MERCNAVKDAIVAGVWGNSNYDSQEEGKEGARRQILEGVEEQFQLAIREIMTGERSERSSDEINWDDPFFAASKAPRISDPPRGETEEQAQRRRMMEDLDQT